MTSAQATAEVFWTAFLAMAKEERQGFLERPVADRRLREDLLDAAILEDRREESTRPLDEVLSAAQTKRAARVR